MEPNKRRARAVLADVAAIAVIVAVGLVDLRTGPYLAFSALYVLPVLLAAWYGSRGAGVAAALASALAWHAAERWGGIVYPHPGIPLWNLAMRLSTLLVVALLVRSLRTQLAIATRVGRTDALTGLGARGWFLQRLETEVRRARRYGHPLSLAYVDVDGFKEVNDTYGHGAGDRLLRRIARTLSEATRAIDAAGRVGGDEFMLLMPETADEDARALVERLQAALNTTTADEGFAVTFSIGVLTFEATPDDPETAVHRVDDLMYRVKRSGKDGFLHHVEG